MTILLDTGIVYAYYDRDDRWSEPARDLLKSEPGPRLIPAPVIPEVDYLLGDRIGFRAQEIFYLGLTEGHYRVVDLPSRSYSRILELNRQYQDLGLGFVDAAILALAEALGLGRIATTDRKHFGAVEIGIPLELLPDAPA